MNHILKISEVNEFEKYIHEVKCFLGDLVYEYPLHNEWFKGIVKELRGKDKTREILLALNDNNIIGVSILKKTMLEKKICTLRVAENYQRQGIGTLLVEKSIEYLQTQKPIITVSQSKHNEFKKLFEYFNFSLERIYFGKYRETSVEYCYNGILLPETILKKETLEKIANKFTRIA